MTCSLCPRQRVCVCVFACVYVGGRVSEYEWSVGERESDERRERQSCRTMRFCVQRSCYSVLVRACARMSVRWHEGEGQGMNDVIFIIIIIIIVILVVVIVASTAN